MTFTIEPLEEDTPGRKTYRCVICERQAEFIAYSDIKFSITVNGTRTDIFDNLDIVGPEENICSEECFTLWILRNAYNQTRL